MPTIVNNRDVSAVVAVRIDNSPPEIQKRVDDSAAWCRARQAKVDGKIADMQDLREERLELEGQEARYQREINYSGLKPSAESEAASQARQKKIEKIKRDRLAVQEIDIPGPAGLFDDVEHWFARHGEKLAFAPTDPKPLPGRSNAEMFKITSEGVAELRQMYLEIDAAPLPLAMGKRAIIRDLDRLQKQFAVSVKSAFQLSPEVSGRLRQGGLGLKKIRLSDSSETEILNPGIFFDVLRPLIENELLARAEKLNLSEALSLEERDADKAELRDKIAKVERDAAEWWWRCRAEGLDVPPPDVPITGLSPSRLDPASNRAMSNSLSGDRRARKSRTNAPPTKTQL